jgi:two-component system response regulator RegX3
VDCYDDKRYINEVKSAKGGKSVQEKILLVEDDRDIVDYLSSFLKNENFIVEAVAGQREAIEKLETREYDLLLIDISLADGNGYAVCAAAKEKSLAAVIFLTASGDEYSVVTGLDMGADDYINKPFRPRELVSRIRSVLRRTGKSQKLLKEGSITVDTVKGIVYRNGEELALSALEYRLLLIFFNNKGVVLSRGRLLSEIWDVAGEFVNDNTLTVYIKRLREKIEDDPSHPVLIKTVRGMGYRL